MKVPFVHGTACSAPTNFAYSAASARPSVLGLGWPPQLPEASTRSTASRSGAPCSGHAGHGRARTGAPPWIASALSRYHAA
jgi:hypothetical protein